MMTSINMLAYWMSLCLMMEPVSSERNRYIRVVGTQSITSINHQKNENRVINFFNPIVNDEKRYLLEEDLLSSMRNLVEYGPYYDMSLSMSMSMSMGTGSTSPHHSKSPASPVANTYLPSKAPIATISPVISTKSPAIPPTSLDNSVKPTTQPIQITEDSADSVSTFAPTRKPTTISSNSTMNANNEASSSVRKVASKPATIASLVVGIMALLSAFTALVARKYHQRSTSRALLSSMSEGKLLDGKGGNADDMSMSTDSPASIANTMEGTATS